MLRVDGSLHGGLPGVVAKRSSADGRNRSASLRRGLALLTALGSDQTLAGGLSLTELAVVADVDKSTALRLLTPLRESGLIEVDDSGRYHLGIGVLRLGQTYLERLDLRAIALPVMRSLTAETGETSHLVLPAYPNVVYIEKVEADAAVQMRSRVGRIEPATSTGVGKALLAAADADVVDDVISRGLTKRTATTITSSRKLRAELAAIRARGFAIDDCENEADIRCAAAAIIDHLGRPSAAISVAGPRSRVSHQRAYELGAVVVDAAATISRALGAHATVGKPTGRLL